MGSEGRIFNDSLALLSQRTSNSRNYEPGPPDPIKPTFCSN